jgi:hypothetical protein
MSKLYKKMVALGNLSHHSYDSIVAACGEPKEKKPCIFSDIGEGSRATWSDGVFVLTLNFDADGNYCGIYHHRNWEPYIITAIVSVVIIAGALVGGYFMRQANEAKNSEPGAVVETAYEYELDEYQEVSL